MVSKADKTVLSGTRASDRPERVSIPIKRIQKLIKVACDNNLALLEVGNIKIVPTPKMPEYRGTLEAGISQLEKKAGRKLTEAQKQDLLLFGAQAVIEELNESDGE